MNSRPSSLCIQVESLQGTLAKSEGRMNEQLWHWPDTEEGMYEAHLEGLFSRCVDRRVQTLPPTYGPDGRAKRLHAGGTHVRSKQRKTKELKTDGGGIDFTYDRAFSPLLVFQSFRN